MCKSRGPIQIIINMIASRTLESNIKFTIYKYLRSSYILRMFNNHNIQLHIHIYIEFYSFVGIFVFHGDKNIYKPHSPQTKSLNLCRIIINQSGLEYSTELNAYTALLKHFVHKLRVHMLNVVLPFFLVEFCSHWRTRCCSSVRNASHDAPTLPATG